jgi:hypothetical protein
MKNDAHEISEVQLVVKEAGVVELSDLELLLIGGGTGEVVIA